MNRVKGKFLKKLKSIKPVDYLKPDRVLQVFAIDGFIDSCPKNPNSHEQPKLFCKEPEEEEEEEKCKDSCFKAEEQPEIIDVAELMRDLEDEDDEEMELDDKENVRPTMEENGNVYTKFETQNRRQSTPLSDINVLSFRKPDLNSCTLFDPNLLAAFELAVKEHKKMSEEERNSRSEPENLDNKSTEGTEKKEIIEEDESLEISEENLEISEENEPPHKTRRIELEVDDDDEEGGDLLLGFEQKCPPGGDGSVILYTTTLKGIRKTFEDCNSVRFLLESFRVVFYERDISMHAEYKEEMWKILEGKVTPPRLFIKGRYIGGAEDVLTLHEQEKLKLLFHGIPLDRFNNTPCEGCAGVRFALCFKCNGSHKIVSDDGLSSKCLQCNENGLIVCPFCC